MMKLAIFPLGNPGDKYKKTRHNAARIVCLSLFKGEKGVTKLLSNNNKVDIELAIPDTYMNESGTFVRAFLKNKKNEDLQVSDKVWPIIMYDDKDLPWGQVKLSYGNSSGGHNGVQSVMDTIGKDFYRIRIGIGDTNIMPIHGEGVVQDYVMSNITDREMKILKSNTLHDAVMQCIIKIQNDLYPL